MLVRGDARTLTVCARATGQLVELRNAQSWSGMRASTMALRRTWRRIIKTATVTP